MDGKTLIIFWCVMVAVSPIAGADGPGRIYTKSAEADAGSLFGKVAGAVLTHAMAVERDRTRVYLAVLDGGGAGFRFEKLPVGRFDLVLITKDGRVIEGLGLGAAAEWTPTRTKHLEAGVAKADSFFNRHVIHRAGVTGDVALAFVERIRDKQILRGSGEEIHASLRRLEIIEFRAADDDWQMVRTRHLYREEAPKIQGLPFLATVHLPVLGGLRLATTPRDLGIIDLTPKNQP